MDKFSFISLWDAYSGLLTPVQMEITDLHFNKDLTVSEIAEQKGISRQAVSDCLKSCKKQLEEYEYKLNFLQKLQECALDFSYLVSNVSKWVEKFKDAHPEFSKEVDELTQVISEDYDDEIQELLTEHPQLADLAEMAELLKKNLFGKIEDDKGKKN